MPERRGVRAQLVGDQQFGCEALLLKQLAHQPQRRPSVAPTLNQHVEDLALVIDGTPQIHSLAGDPYYHLVKVPEPLQFALSVSTRLRNAVPLSQYDGVSDPTRTRGRRRSADTRTICSLAAPVLGNAAPP